MPSASPSLILIVDDNPKNLQLLGEVLRNEGFRVGVAQNGELALAAVEIMMPDLILMDVMMPVMDGFEACKRLQANPKTCHIPVIFLTARVESEDINNGFEAGGVDYVSKPFQKGELLARVNTHIRIEKMSQAQIEFNLQLKQQNKQLSLANNQLKALKQQAVESAKMVSLGNMLIWIAHEINTPLGISITSSSYQEQIIDNLKLGIKQEELDKISFTQSIDQLFESNHMITAALKQLSNIIDECKQLATNKAQRHSEEFLVMDNLAILPEYFKDKCSSASHSIDIHCPAEMTLISYPDVLFQVFCILIENSLIHGYEDHRSGVFSITVKQDFENTYIEYSDDGQGISCEHLTKIYEPFFTTKRHEGNIGLGLSVLYNLVNQVLDGEVCCESDNAQKTTFFLVLPIKQS